MLASLVPLALVSLVPLPTSLLRTAFNHSAYEAELNFGCLLDQMLLNQFAHVFHAGSSHVGTWIASKASIRSASWVEMN